jgi:hypothetical protein
VYAYVCRRQEDMTACLTLDQSFQSKSLLRCVTEGASLTLSDDGDEFNERVVKDLLQRLDGPIRLPLLSHEKALLITVVEGTHEVSRS